MSSEPPGFHGDNCERMGGSKSWEIERNQNTKTQVPRSKIQTLKAAGTAMDIEQVGDIAGLGFRIKILPYVHLLSVVIFVEILGRGGKTVLNAFLCPTGHGDRDEKKTVYCLGSLRREQEVYFAERIQQPPWEKLLCKPFP